MEIKFQLARDEYKEAQRTYFLRIRPRAERLLWIGILVSACPMLMFPVFMEWKYGSRYRPAGTVGLVILIGAAIGTLRGMRRFDGPDYADPQTIEISQEGLLAKNAFGRTALPTLWARIGRFVETDRLFMLSSPWSPLESSFSQHNPRRGWLPQRPTVYILPKRAFDVEQLRVFRSLLQNGLSHWARDLGQESASVSHAS
jgi:hypothetical protein